MRQSKTVQDMQVVFRRYIVRVHVGEQQHRCLLHIVVDDDDDDDDDDW